MEWVHINTRAKTKQTKTEKKKMKMNEKRQTIILSIERQSVLCYRLNGQQKSFWKNSQNTYHWKMDQSQSFAVTD